MKITVLGATGLIGHRIGDQLENRGHQVVRAHRGTGVDVSTGQGVDSAVAGSEVVVDALDLKTMSGKRATDFFTTTAQNIVQASESAGVQRIVCVSIYGAADPAVNKYYGYYKGKAAQQATYRSTAVASTLILSTQWFELIGEVARRASLGPVTLLPTMRLAALSADDAAGSIADEAESAAAGDRTVTIRGEHEATALELARAILEARGDLAGRHPRVLHQLPYLGPAIAGGGLIPAEADIVAPDTLSRWLRS